MKSSFSQPAATCAAKCPVGYNTPGAKGDVLTLNHVPRQTMTMYENRTKRTHFCRNQVTGSPYHSWYCDVKVKFIYFTTGADKKNHRVIEWDVPDNRGVLVAAVAFKDGGVDIFDLKGNGLCEDVHDSARSIDRIEIYGPQ